jgi:D-ribose pyranase
MFQTNPTNPHLLHLLTRIRHTNTLVIADIGFPFWPQIETVDISLTRDAPTVLQVLEVIRPHFVMDRAFMAGEFLTANSAETQAAFRRCLAPAALVFEPHVTFKLRVPHAIGLIRTGGTQPYTNIILESA